MTKFLLRRGADKNIKNSAGETAHDVAKKYHFNSVIDLLDTVSQPLKKSVRHWRLPDKINTNTEKCIDVFNRPFQRFSRLKCLDRGLVRMPGAYCPKSDIAWYRGNDFLP